MEGSAGGQLTCRVELAWCRNLGVRRPEGSALRSHCSAARTHTDTQTDAQHIQRRWNDAGGSGRGQLIFVADLIAKMFQMQ